jgi:hypothetical protein
MMNLSINGGRDALRLRAQAIAYVAGSLVIVGLVGGCVWLGTVGAVFQLDVHVSGTDATGKSWVATRTQIVKVAPPEGSHSQLFDRPVFVGHRFELSFNAGSTAFGGSVLNKTSSELCFRFDQALMASSDNPIDQPFRVTGLHHTIFSQLSVMGYGTGKQRPQPFTPPKLCFLPGRNASFSFSPVLPSLYSNATMFNVSWLDKKPELVERGIGNFFLFKVPIESTAGVELVEVKLTALDSKVHIRYH